MEKHPPLETGVGAGTALAATMAQASTTSGYISDICTMPGGQILFSVSNDRPRPSYATVANRWAFDSTTPQGQAKLALLLTFRESASARSPSDLSRAIS